MTLRMPTPPSQIKRKPKPLKYQSKWTEIKAALDTGYTRESICEHFGIKGFATLYKLMDANGYPYRKNGKRTAQEDTQQPPAQQTTEVKH